MFGNSKSSRDGQLVVDALIGNQVVIRGDVEFSGGLYVEGRIHGKVTALEGASSATLTLAENGVIEGEIRAQVVEMSAGAQLNGRLIHTSSTPVAALPPPEAGDDGGTDAATGRASTAARRKLAEAMG